MTRNKTTRKRSLEGAENGEQMCTKGEPSVCILPSLLRYRRFDIIMRLFGKAGTQHHPMAAGAGIWSGPPQSWPPEHCRVLYAISTHAQQARSLQSKETWIRQIALFVLLYEGIDAGVLRFNYSPCLVWLTFKRHTDRRWLRVSQEANSVIDDLWEAKLVNGIKLSSVDYQPVTAYQASLRGLSIVHQMPQYLKTETHAFLFAPTESFRVDGTPSVAQSSHHLLQVRYDGMEFHLVTSDQSYSKVSTITECDDVSYVSSPYIPRCLCSSTSFLVEPTNNQQRATEAATGYNMVTNELEQSLILSHVHAVVGEWLPFGANQISALNERLGAMERCQGGLFSSKLDLRPTETHFEVTPGLTQVKILDFDAIRFINFEAEINFPQSDGVIQVEHFGMHLHVSGAVLYGVKIEAIRNHTERSIPLDLLARLLVDVHQDSSDIVHDLLSRYQLSVLDMLFLGKPDHRNKYNLIMAASMEPKLTACTYLDHGKLENELKQVLGEIYACYDITRDNVLFLGRDGCLFTGPGADRYEALLIVFIGLNSRDLFLRNFFARTFVLKDLLTDLRHSIASYGLHGESPFKTIMNSLSEAARHMILLIECLQYLLESVETLDLPSNATDMAGSRICKCLQLLERKNNIIVRCKDSIKLIERLRTQLDALITRFEGLLRLQLTHVSREFDLNIQRLTDSVQVGDHLQRSLDVIRVIFAGNLSFDVIDRLSGGTFNVPNPQWFVEYFKKPIMDTPCVFLVLNLCWFAVVWMASQFWLTYQVTKRGATVAIRAQTDKRINVTQLRRMLLKRKVRLGAFEYETGGKPELQSYEWEEPAFPFKNSTTHVQVLVDETQKLLRSIRLQVASPLDDSASSHAWKRNVSTRISKLKTSCRLHPTPSSVKGVENHILEQFATLLRKEGVYQEPHAPLARLGSQMNLLNPSQELVEHMDGSRIRRRRRAVDTITKRTASSIIN